MRYCVIMSFLSVSFVYTVNRKKKRSEKERRRAMDGFMILGIVLLAAGFLFVGIETLIPGFGAPGILGG